MNRRLDCYNAIKKIHASIPHLFTLTTTDDGHEQRTTATAFVRIVYSSKTSDY